MDKLAGDIYFKAGTLQSKIGHYSDAVKSLEAALGFYGRNLGPGSYESIPILKNLANALSAQSQPYKAVPYYQQALTLQERSLGIDNSSTIRTKEDLANAYVKAGDYISAQRLLKELAQLAAKNQQMDTNTKLEILNLYVSVLKQNNKIEEAEQITQKINEIKDSK
jgi:tetratricopeptide (TPR) repeat protein